MIKLLTYPWEILQGEIAQDSSVLSNIEISYYSQILLSQEEKVQCAATGRSFPTTIISKEAKVVELPRPAITGDMSRKLVVELNKNDVFTVKYYNNQEVSLRNYFERFFDQTMNAILFFIRDCLNVENHKTKNIYWLDILKKVHEDPEEDPAKYALIVDLARPTELIEPISRITEKPKKVLKRIHDQEKIHRVKEIDVKCLSDLARRPGTVITEKAGYKQRILAIKRTEKIDTLENRVTKHCCLLASNASKRYLSEHIKVENSKRINAVEKLQNACLRLPLKTTFQGITNLIEPCRQPNYTLMQNPDYTKVWNAYVKLVRNEDLRNELWRWNRRMWADYMGLFIADLLQKKMSDDKIILYGEKTVYGQRKHEMGNWLLSDVMPGPYIINHQNENSSTLYCTQGYQEAIKNLGKTYQILAYLNADHLLILIGEKKKIVLPIYAIIPPQNLNIGEYDIFLKNLLPSLINCIGEFNKRYSNWTCNSGLVLLANWANRFCIDKVKDFRKSVVCWAAEIDPDYSKWSRSFEQCGEPLLELCRI